KGGALLWIFEQLIGGHGLSQPFLRSGVGSIQVRVTCLGDLMKRGLDGLVTGILWHAQNIVRRYHRMNSQYDSHSSACLPHQAEATFWLQCSRTTRVLMELTFLFDPIWHSPM